MSSGVIDINVSYGHWPFQEFAINELRDVASHLKSCRIDEAYVSHIGAVLAPEPSRYNRILVEDCALVEGMNPVPTIHAGVPGWSQHLDDLRGQSDISVVKVYPSYHNVSLSSAEMEAVAEYVRLNKLRLFVGVRLEDERTRYHGMSVVGVPVEEIAVFAQKYQDLSITCLNCYLPEIKRLAEFKNVSFDTSFADWMFVMEELAQTVGLSRVLFGSHTPFLYTRASLAKVNESRLTEPQKAQVLAGNAKKL